MGDATYRLDRLEKELADAQRRRGPERLDRLERGWADLASTEAEFRARIIRLEVDLNRVTIALDVGNHLARIERLEQHLDRQNDLIEGLLDVLISTHPDSVQLFGVLKEDARARLKIVVRND